MTKPGETPLTRPAIGVQVDPERMAAARKSAMLERVELAHLSQALDLTRIARDHGITCGPLNLDDIVVDEQALRKVLIQAGVSLKGLRIGVSRDEIAKLETGGRKRPKITTLRKLITALNYALADQGEPPVNIKDLQVPGEVLIPEYREKDIPEWEAKLLQDKALAEYQEASNEIYYAMRERDERADDE